MGLRAGLKWVAMEGTGAGVQQRLVRRILGKPGGGAVCANNLVRQFIVAAAAVVTRFGPAWARIQVGGQAVGVWLLLLCWLAPTVLLALAVVYSSRPGFQWPKDH